MSAPTREQVFAALEVVRLLADTVRALGSIPSGHLYAQVMDHLSFESYENAIDLLKRAGLVDESGHVLKWVGPLKGGAS